jgi:hypothetical protein
MSVIKIVRLNSGEEVLCGWDGAESPHEEHILKKPLLIIPTGEGQIGLMSWMPYSNMKDDSVSVKDSFVAFVVDPAEELKAEYKNATSNIIVPDKTVSSAPNLKIVGSD